MDNLNLGTLITSMMVEFLDVENTKKVKSVNNVGLDLRRVEVDAKYLKEWNENSKDFCHLYKDGVLLSNTLYRLGGLNSFNSAKDKYSMLLKYEEAFYSDEIMKASERFDNGRTNGRDRKINKNSNKHLKGYWVIVDKDGNEKVSFANSFDSAYLIKDSCLYTYKNCVFNIETGYNYGSSNYRIDSKDYVFIDNKYDSDKSKRGVVKISKSDGAWEWFE